jgi:hypothetical protein
MLSQKQQLLLGQQLIVFVIIGLFDCLRLVELKQKLA